MRIRLLLFGSLKDMAGRESDSLELPERATVGDLLERYAVQELKLRNFLPNVAVAVNEEYAPKSRELKESDEVALIPPVSGGANTPDSSAHDGDGKVSATTRICLVRERIDTTKLTESLKQGEDGAVVVFEGIVRNHSRGRRTLYLDYEAYEGMARKQLELLATEALKNFSVRDVSIAHRLGRIQIGETSVAIVVVSAHRAAAFEACRWIIDTLKRSVPIWKKEYFEDGAVWADGEPFPEGTL